jgi:hypothetical protein
MIYKDHPYWPQAQKDGSVRLVLPDAYNKPDRKKWLALEPYVCYRVPAELSVVTKVEWEG